MATKSNAKGTVKLLVGCGADMEILNNEGQTALLCAAEEGYINIVNTLLNGGAKVDLDFMGENMLAIAVATGDIEAVRMYTDLPAKNAAIRQFWYILQAPQLQELSEAAETALWLAVSLLQPKSARDSTLLHWACQAGDSTLARSMLKCGIADMSPDQNLWTPWRVASRRGYSEICQMLEDAGRTPEIPLVRQIPTHWVVDASDGGGRLDRRITRLLCPSRGQTFNSRCGCLHPRSRRRRKLLLRNRNP
ncbi:ankyrin [Wilcoxina mikolae CBS 423.85]|nr:ankyrin [Wilcoxina mikolae CBS 423.85]